MKIFKLQPRHVSVLVHFDFSKSMIELPPPFASGTGVDGGGLIDLWASYWFNN